MPELYPFQRKGVDFLLARKGRALLADDPGLGKSPQALFYLAEAPVRGRVLIVSPASVIYKWAQEVEKWFPAWGVQVVPTGKTPLPRTKITVMSYALAARRARELSEQNYRAVIWDECHALKNYRSQRYKAAAAISQSIPAVLGLSGTPFLNRPAELFNFLNMLDPFAWPDRYQYWARYCGLREKWIGRKVLDYTGSSNEDELSKRLRTYMLRREKVDVLDQLPPITRTIIPIAISNRTEYKKADMQLMALIRKNGHGAGMSTALAHLNILRRVMGEGKVKAAVAFAEDFLDGSSEKLVIYAHHRSVCAALRERLSKWGVAWIVGGVSLRERQQSITAFQTSATPRIMIISEAGGEGIDLYRASNILFVEREWTPAQEEQAESRLHRIGQQSGVVAWYLVAKDTLDLRIDRLIKRKRQVRSRLYKTTEPDVTIREDLLRELAK